MCLSVASRQRLLTLLGCWLITEPTGGCARPEGLLFPAMEPPMVWPPSPNRPRIRYVGTLSDSGDLKAAQSGLEVTKAVFRGPRPPIRFAGPLAVAVHPRGVLAVADGAAAAVHLIDLEARTHRRVNGWDDQRFVVPLGVAWAGDRLFVSDAQRHEVIELDMQGRYLRRFGAEVLSRPVGIAYLPDRDRLYVVDGASHRLAVFDLTGALVETIGQRGAGPGEFNFPTHICYADGRLLVADSGNFRVQLLDPDGRCLRTIGQEGDGAGDFAMPKGVAFDSDGHVYVGDTRFENIQVFDVDGRLLMAWGEEGGDVGEFSLPAGLAIDERDRIWVADAGNRRIQVFAYMGDAQ
ncbi:MAG: 6-bladed beta-propeller [Phycisphaerae bacterium]